MLSLSWLGAYFAWFLNWPIFFQKKLLDVWQTNIMRLFFFLFKEFLHPKTEGPNLHFCFFFSKSCWGTANDVPLDWGMLVYHWHGTHLGPPLILYDGTGGADLSAWVQGMLTCRAILAKEFLMRKLLVNST